MAGGGNAGARELDATPTWAVAFVCAVIIIISIVLEKVLHKWFEKRNKNALVEAMEKVKGELMVLGFISLLLTFGQNYIASFCIPVNFANTMLPCPSNQKHHARTDGAAAEHHRRLLWYEHRLLGGGGDTKACKYGHAPLISINGLHQLHIFIFFLAVFHVISSATTMTLGRMKIRGWKFWERETMQENEMNENEMNDPTRFRLTHETSFVKDHNAAWTRAKAVFYFVCFFRQFFRSVTKADYLSMRHGFIYVHLAPGSKFNFQKYIKRSLEDNFKIVVGIRFRLTHETSFMKDHNAAWTRAKAVFYFVCFFRQFFRSVTKADYLSMRHGFIYVHLAPRSKFNFQKYIKRSLEDNFKIVVGISPLLWASAILYLLLNVHGWDIMIWVLSFMPLVVILAIGTKLQAIISQMALEIQERHAVVQGIPLMQVSDNHFWFSWPQLILYLIHLTLFQNAFEITYFFWTWYEFGKNSCFHDSFGFAIIRVCVGVGAQFLCSYITLPLYALVTQMGSTMKRSIFYEQTSKALMQWHRNALKKKDVKSGPTQARTLGDPSDALNDDLSNGRS